MSGPSSSSVLPTTAAPPSINPSTSTAVHQHPPAASRRRKTRRRFGVLGFSFRVPPRLQDAFVAGITCLVDSTVYLLGPFLICFAILIASGLTYSFFVVVLPMMKRAYEIQGVSLIYRNVSISLHVTYVLFVLVNVLYNYALCVVTSNKGPRYDRVVREMAAATDFSYPETPQEVEQYERDFRERMLFRLERRQARAAAAAAGHSTTAAATAPNTIGMTHRRTTNSPHATANTNTTTTTTNTTTTTTVAAPPPARPRAWMLMGPHEWGFCINSKQPKPPRAHYDHVTKTLVLNMDHYCPWVFNTIGYFNYRYFVNFLLFVLIGMLYGTLVTLRPFYKISSPDYYDQVRASRHVSSSSLSMQQQHLHPWTPLPHERSAIAFSFMLSLSIGLAVLCLGAFHVYLVLTAQTTIEFHGNWANKRRAKRQKRTWTNPYDLGYRRNWQQVYGTGRAVWALLIPSSREPEFLPVPVAGEIGRRPPRQNGHSKRQLQVEVEDGTEVERSNGEEVV